MLIVQVKKHLFMFRFTKKNNDCPQVFLSPLIFKTIIIILLNLPVEQFLSPNFPISFVPNGLNSEVVLLLLPIPAKEFLVLEIAFVC